MKFQKTILASALAVLFVLSGCKGSVDMENKPESFFPDTVDFVGVLDYSNDAQRKNIEALLKKFPEMPLLEAAYKEGFYAELNSGDADSIELFETKIKPLLKSKWKLAAGIDADEINPAETWNGEGLYLAAYFEEITLIEELIFDNFEEDGITINKIADDQWTVENENAYIARKGNVLLLTSDEAHYKNMLSVAESGEGNIDVTPLKPDNIGYIYGNLGDSLTKLISALPDSSMDLAKMFDSLSNIQGVVVAEKGGLRFYEEITFDDGGMEGLFPKENSQLNFVDKVPVSDVILYVEDFSSEAFFRGFFSSIYAASPEAIEGDTYEKGIETLGNFIGAEAEDVKAMIAAPQAWVVSDVDTLYPAIAAYVFVGEGNADMAKNMETLLDNFVDAVIVEVDSLLADEGSQAVGLIKREAVVVDGAGLHKVYLDWAALPPEILAQGAVIPNLTDTKVEFYYGLTADNVFVAALYPDFDKAYGKDTLEKNATYKKAMKGLSIDKAARMTMLRVAPVFNIVDKYLDIASNLGALNEEDAAIFAEVEALTKTFDYIINAAQVVDGVLKSELFISIEQVKK